MIEDSTQHITNLLVAIHIPSAQSLKDKRMVVKSLKERIRNKFNVSVAEVAGQDKWQVATLAFVMTGTDQKIMDRTTESILSFIERNHGVELCEHEIENL